MSSRFALLFAITLPAVAADWNPRLAAQYLDARQEKWFAWPTANASGVPCISCHTGVTYLLARPALRRALGETQPTTFETGLLNSLRSRLAKTTPKELFPKNQESFATQGTGVEAVFAALFLAGERDAPQAFDRMWSVQLRDGAAKGAFPWFSLELDPWEMPPSNFYGASLAAIAVGSAAPGYRAQPDVRERVTALTGYLQRELDSQPLHNRLHALWASTKLPDALPASAQRRIIDDAWKKQQPDGSWTMEALGSWSAHEAAPHSAGNAGYATGLTAFILARAGVARSDARLARALDWLRAHQDPKSGYWEGESMNKQYPPDSMMTLFMRDAATAYAALALL
jgi:squalene-hopene/tetraprenyl-beta-curcumene cyclase